MRKIRTQKLLYPPTNTYEPTGVKKIYGFFNNGHEADMNCVTEPLNEYRKSICYFVKIELFLINGHEAIQPGQIRIWLHDGNKQWLIHYIKVRKIG